MFRPFWALQQQSRSISSQHQMLNIIISRVRCSTPAGKTPYRLHLTKMSLEHTSMENFKYLIEKNGRCLSTTSNSFINNVSQLATEQQHRHLDEIWWSPWWVRISHWTISVAPYASFWTPNHNIRAISAFPFFAIFRRWWRLVFSPLKSLASHVRGFGTHVNYKTCLLQCAPNKTSLPTTKVWNWAS